MAQKVQVILVDDLDGGPADDTVTFSLDGVSYEIDLNTANANAMRDAFAPYVTTGRRVSGRSSAGRKPRGGGDRTGDNRTAEIRAWARSNGKKVNERGRLPATVVAAFDDAH